MKTPHKTVFVHSVMYPFYLVLLLPGVLFLASCHSRTSSSIAADDSYLYSLTKKSIALSDSIQTLTSADPIADFQTQRLNKLTTPEEYYVTYRAVIEYLNSHKGQTEQALAEASKLHLIFEEKFPEPRYNIYHAHTFLLNATLQLELNNFSAAIQLLTPGLSKIQPQHSPCIAGEYFQNLASLSYQQQNYLQSIDYNHQTRNYQLACDNEETYPATVQKYQNSNNIAASYYGLGNYQESLSHYNMSLETIYQELENQDFFSSDLDYRKVNLEIALAVTQGNKATILALLNAGAEAEKLWKESIEVNSQPGYANQHAQLMKLRMAEHLIQTGRMDESRALLDETAIWLAENSSTTGEIRWYRLLALWHDKTGNTEQAYEGYQAYTQLKNVQQELKKAFMTADIPAHLQHMQQQNRIKELSMRSEIRKTYLISIIFVIATGLILLFLVWKSWHTSQKNLRYLHRLNKKSELKNKELQKKNTALTEITNIVRHDLRRPLTRIRDISVQMMEDQNLNSTYKEWGNLIHNVSKQAFSLTDEIQNMTSNMHNGQNKNDVTLHIIPVDLNQFLQGCIELFRIKAREKNQKIIFYSGINSILYIDPDKMARVINNLLDNAIKFTPAEGLIEIRTLPYGEYIRILIQDNGIGISKEIKEHVFDMYFYKSDAATEHTQTSYGIGLAVCKEIIEKHHGNIWFENIETGGTRFIIELPEKASPAF